MPAQPGQFRADVKRFGDVPRPLVHGGVADALPHLALLRHGTLCLLADHELSGSGSDADAISLPRVASVLGADCGFCHTVERNLAVVAGLWAAEPLAGASHDVAAQARALQAAIEAAPKSLAWRVRSRVGERVRWYETPEEVRH